MHLKMVVPPLTCTNTTYLDVDYGIPISIYKSTDYRTTYNTHHRWICPKGQDFMARGERPDLRTVLPSDWNIKDINYKSEYNAEYTEKQSNSVDDATVNPAPLQNVHYVMNVQEELFKEPPPCIKFRLSEMKDNYRYYPYAPQYNTDCHDFLCAIKGLGRDEQPPLRPNESGYNKYLDIYLTTYRGTYIKHPDQAYSNRVEPVNPKPLEPLVPRTPDPVYDKLVFKFAPKTPVRDPAMKILECAKKSVYGADYIPQTFSGAYPNLHLTSEFNESSIPEASCWQNLCAPGMYCTENCHIGTGWPINAIVDPLGEENPVKNPLKGHPYNPCCKKFTDDWF